MDKISMEKLDDTDMEILKQLQDHAQITTRELASRINLSSTPVYERVKRLEREGFIQKYTVVLDRHKLNRGLMVFCNVSLKQHSREIGEQFVKDIVSLPEVAECYNISGDYDFLLKILVKDMPHYQDFVLNGLGSIDNIGGSHSIFVMGEIKNVYGLPL